MAVYGHFPLLLDLLWQQSGSWVCFYLKLACAPHDISQGGKYEFCITVQDSVGRACDFESADGSGSDEAANDLDDSGAAEGGGAEAAREVDNTSLEE